jgi:hypothetical protein
MKQIYVAEETLEKVYPYVVKRDNKNVCLVTYRDRAAELARVLNAETAPLLERIAALEAKLAEVDKILSTNITQYGVSIYDAVEDAREVIAGRNRA